MIRKSFFAPLGILFIASFSSGTELLDAIESDTYWNLAGIEKSAESLIPLLEIGAAPAADLTAIKTHIANLSSPEFAKRQRAVAALDKAGPEARPQLEKARQSDDPEVVATAERILATLERVEDDGQIDRLMAIRTLGEIKALAAVPHLEKLVDSPEPFVADYAARALAGIRREKFDRTKTDPRSLDKDLKITYPASTMLMHLRLDPREGGVKIRGAMDKALSLVGKIKIDGAPGIAKLETDEMLTEMTGDLVDICRRIGNARIDTVTMVVPEAGEMISPGYVFTIRGDFDHRRILAELQKSQGERIGITKEGDKEWLSIGSTSLHLPSDDLMVIVLDDFDGGYRKAVSRRLAGVDKALATGVAVDLAKGVPKAATALFATEIPEAMAEGDEVLSQIKSMVVWSTPQEDGRSKLSAKVEGKDEQKVSDFYFQANLWLAIAKGAVTAMAKSDDELVEIAEIVNSLDLDRNKSTISADVVLPPVGTTPFGAVLGGIATIRTLMSASPEMLEELAPDGLLELEGPALEKEFKFELR